LKTETKIFAHVDWPLLVLYASLVIFGWFNIYAVSYESALNQSLFNLSSNAGRQFLWITTVIFLFCISFFFEARFYQSLAYVFYAFAMLLMLGTLFWGVNIGGHRAWFQWGGQPSELAKLACAMAIARYIDEAKMQLTRLKPQLILWGLVLLPVVMILLQGDVGSSLVFIAFVIVFYREGLSSWFILVGVSIVIISVLTLLVPRIYLIIGTISLALILIGLVRKNLKKSVLVVLMTIGTLVMIEGFHPFVDNVLKPHQQNRIKALVDPNVDPLGIGWNVTQSKIAIGSGGLWGKGFLQGSQTKYGFVPEQSTDFIFCTVGEEWGFVGSTIVLGLFVLLLLRLIFLAERQRSTFSRIYGYGLASIIFFHLAINIGMTIGLAPVVGIPLPFFSYGGSSLWSFTILTFIFIRLDAYRFQILR